MRSGVWLLACLVLALGVSPVSAQPLFRIERDWTIEVDGRLYGFRGVVQTPGDVRWTQVWIAGRRFQPAIDPEDWWVLALPPVPVVLAVRSIPSLVRTGRP